MEEKRYIAIDLKSFYASVECVERGLDPLTTNLVVADPSRTQKTICLAVSPTLKAYGIGGRSRLFEVAQKVREVNIQRQKHAPGHRFAGTSSHAPTLAASPELALDYIVAPPQMAHYIKCSAEIYNIYLKYVAPEDIHVYSIDEVFIDATPYLRRSKLSAHEFAMLMILDVLSETGITATAGIGTNLYLAKVAMDIGAKRIPADENGVRIAELDELTYRQTLWAHQPIRDFWRVGRGIAKKLARYGMHTMGDVARCSLGGPADYRNESLLYELFGVNAELLIDHAWGYESCTMADIKAYRPGSNSISSGQVLMAPYTFEKAKLIVREMVDLMVLDLVDKGLVTDQLVLMVGYDVESLKNPALLEKYKDKVSKDYYGRAVPKHAHGSTNLGQHMSSTKRIQEAVLALFDRIVDEALLVRRIHLTANHVIAESAAVKAPSFEQLDLFTNYEAAAVEQAEAEAALAREKRMQQAILTIQKKYGKNAILKGTSFEEGATGKSRNEQIGGHKA